MNLLRALLVSQDDAARRDVAQLLSDYSFDCVQAADGIDALQFASRDGVDLIVTDVRLPKMDGPQFLDIVTDGAFGAKPPPVIMCASLLVMARPSPVPPYLRVMVASACSNGVKRRAICSWVKPIPLS